MSDNESVEEPLVGEVRVRVPLPIIIPLAGLAFIAFMAIAFSRILLHVPHEAATIVAIATAANILGACAYMALRPRMEAGSMFELGAVVIYPVIIGVAIAQLGIGETTHAEEPTPQASVSAPAPGASDTIVAKGFAFDVTEVELPAGETVPYTLDNQDTAAHNFAIYASEADGLAKKDPLFTGADVAAGASVTYDVTAPEKGKYHFQCDIHPSMKGTLITT